jgi:hypothetical protein
MSTHDAYVARDVIAHPAHAALTPAEQEKLHRAVRAAHLHRRHDQALEHRLVTALNQFPAHVLASQGQSVPP